MDVPSSVLRVGKPRVEIFFFSLIFTAVDQQAVVENKVNLGEAHTFLAHTLLFPSLLG